jgi:hypothetical protein
MTTASNHFSTAMPPDANAPLDRPITAAEALM